MAIVLMGLDLSLREAVGVTAPIGWDRQWSAVNTRIIGAPLERAASDMARALRTESIARRIVNFAKAEGVTEAWIESYAFGKSTAAHSLGELGGVVRLELVRAGIDIKTANMGSARKLLLGKVTPNAKTQVYATVRAAGSTFETMGETDAFCILNYAMAERGGSFFGQVAACRS